MMKRIRKATHQDSKDLARLLFMAMPDIIYSFIGKSSEKEGVAFLYYFTAAKENQYSYQNCWVMEDENRQVIGAIDVYEGARLRELRKPVIDYIERKYKRTFAWEDETSAGEYYIDSFGIEPSQRGKGTGKAMLQFIINEFVEERGGKIGLLVDQENPGAKKLYISLGFTVKSEKIFAGKRMEHMQLGRLQMR